MATPVEIQYRVVGADQVAGALQQMENRARQMSSAMTGTMAPAQQAVRALSSGLSGAATIARLAGDAGQVFGQRLETATIAISAATVAIQALRAATLAWAGAMSIANAAMVALAATAATLVAVLTAPFTIALVATTALAVGIALLDRRLRGLKDAFAITSQATDDFAFALMRGDVMAFAMGQAVSALRQKVADLGRTEADWAKIRQFVAKDSFVLIEQQARLAEAATREAAAQKKLSDAIREARTQRELDVIVQTNVADRARATVAGLLQQTQFIRDAADASIDWAQIERDLVVPAMRAAIDLFLSFKTSAEEGVIQPARQITENFEAIADAARQAARILGVEWAEALTVARQALQLAKEEGIGLADALARIKFNRDFLIELEFVDSGMKKWLDTWEKIKFGPEDINIQGAVDPALAALDQLVARANEIKQAIGQAFSGLFSDILSGARTFGDALSNFFRAIANVILQHFILKIILPFLGLQRGGIVAGGLTPIFAAQGGGIVSRPTLALMGEGGQDEMVLNRRQAREFIGLPEGQTARPREAVIHLTIHNVIGDPRALGIMTAGDVAGVIVNDVSRRGPTIQAIRVALS